jgi:hypothetical protein
LSSSDGWNCTGPIASQRDAPFTFTPTPGSLTAAVSAKPATSRMGVNIFASFRPRFDMTCSTTSPSRPKIT